MEYSVAGGGIMYGYKVYYSRQNKFLVSDEFSESHYSECDCWCYSHQTAVKTAYELNRMLNTKKIFVFYCKACHKPFMLSDKTLAWYNDKGLKYPARCCKCRCVSKG